MSNSPWQLKPKDVFALSPVIPVVVIDRLEDAQPLAQALLQGGINTIEVTLRTDIALEVIKILSHDVPQLCVGVGTITNQYQLEASIEAGAAYAISPGLTPSLLNSSRDYAIPLIPGVATISEIMQGLELGYDHFKFFPALHAGGPNMLKAFHGPLPHVRFCPTGGINAENFRDYLALPNVDCVGGSWVVPENLIHTHDWQTITALCTDARNAYDLASCSH